MRLIRELDNTELKERLVESKNFYREIVYMNQFIVTTITHYPLPETNDVSGFDSRITTKSPFEALLVTNGSLYFTYVKFDLIGTNHRYTGLDFANFEEMKKFINEHFDNNGTFFTENIRLRIYDIFDPEIEQITKLKGINSVFSLLRGKGKYDNHNASIMDSDAFNNWGSDWIKDLINYDRNITTSNVTANLIWLTRRSNCGETIKLYDAYWMGQYSGRQYYDPYTDSAEPIDNWDNVPGRGIIFDKFYCRFFVDYNNKIVTGWHFNSSVELSQLCRPQLIIYKIGNAEETTDAITQWGYLVKPVGADMFIINNTVRDKSKYYVDVIYIDEKGNNKIVHRVDANTLSEYDGNLGFIYIADFCNKVKIGGKAKSKTVKLLVAFREKSSGLLGNSNKFIKMIVGNNVLFAFC